MTGYTRLTVAGRTRRTEVVVASTEPLGAALPQLLQLLDETTGTVARPLTLVGVDGERLDIARSPQQLELLDGSLLRLERLDAAPPPPVVIDVTDVAADAHDARPDRWDGRARMIAAGTAIALAFTAVALLVPLGTAPAAVVAPLAVLLGLLSAAVGLGLGGLARVSGCLTAAAAGLTIPLGVAAADQLARIGAPGALLGGAAALIAAAAVVVLLGVGVAHRRRGAVAGGVLGLVLAGGLLILLLAGVAPVPAAAIAGTVAAFATGPLPWIALSTAGLTDLDRRVGTGERLSRTTADQAIDEAYAALTWSVAAVAAVLAAAGVTLAADGELWSGLLALAFAVVAMLRSRAFPLRVQVWLLWAAGAAIAVAAIVGRLGAWPWAAAAVAIAAAVVIAAAALVDPRPHTRARLRGIGNALETLAVVALLPVLLGVLGVYAELLGMFGGGS